MRQPILYYEYFFDVRSRSQKRCKQWIIELPPIAKWGVGEGVAILYVVLITIMWLRRESGTNKKKKLE